MKKDALSVSVIIILLFLFAVISCSSVESSEGDLPLKVSNQRSQNCTISVSDKGDNITGVYTVKIPAETEEFAVYEKLPKGTYDIDIVCKDKYFLEVKDLKHPEENTGTLIIIPGE